MKHTKLVDGNSYVAALITLVLTLLLFYSNSNAFWDSFGASIMAAALVWVSYVLTRWIYLALK